MSEARLKYLASLFEMGKSTQHKSDEAKNFKINMTERRTRSRNRQRESCRHGIKCQL